MPNSNMFGQVDNYLSLQSY